MRRFLLILLLVISAAGFIAFAVITIKKGSGKVVVDLRVVPDYASVYIDGKPTKLGKSYVNPGKHSFRAESDGFEASEKSFDIENSQKISFLLTPVSTDAKNWASKNQNLYLEAEKNAGDQSNQEGEAFQDQNPIVAFLPYRSLLFQIEYEIDKDTGKVRLIIIADDANERRLAIKQINNWGFEPGDYQYGFVNFNNPLEQI